MNISNKFGIFAASCLIVAGFTNSSSAYEEVMFDCYHNGDYFDRVFSEDACELRHAQLSNSASPPAVFDNDHAYQKLHHEDCYIEGIITFLY